MILESGRIKYDTETAVVVIDGKRTVTLTGERQREVLKFLLEQEGGFVASSQILERVGPARSQRDAATDIAALCYELSDWGLIEARKGRGYRVPGIADDTVRPEYARRGWPTEAQYLAHLERKKTGEVKPEEDVVKRGRHELNTVIGELRRAHWRVPIGSGKALEVLEILMRRGEVVPVNDLLLAWPEEERAPSKVRNAICLLRNNRVKVENCRGEGYRLEE